MNVKLECYVAPYIDRMGYILEKQGREVKSEITTKFGNDNKFLMLKNIHSGLCAAKGEVGHEDVLTVVVQSRQIATSLKSREERALSTYSEILDKIFDVIDSIDCKYRVVYLEKYPAITIIKKGTVKAMELEGIDSLLSME